MLLLFTVLPGVCPAQALVAQGMFEIDAKRSIPDTTLLNLCWHAHKEARFICKCIWCFHGSTTSVLSLQIFKTYRTRDRGMGLRAAACHGILVSKRVDARKPQHLILELHLLSNKHTSCRYQQSRKQHTWGLSMLA